MFGLRAIIPNNDGYVSPCVPSIVQNPSDEKPTLQ
jgi:hypothetical protein